MQKQGFALDIPQFGKHLIYGDLGVFPSGGGGSRETLVFAGERDKPDAFPSAILVNVQISDSCEKKSLRFHFAIPLMQLKPSRLHQVLSIVMVMSECVGIPEATL